MHPRRPVRLLPGDAIDEEGEKRPPPPSYLSVFEESLAQPEAPASPTPSARESQRGTRGGARGGRGHGVVAAGGRRLSPGRRRGSPRRAKEEVAEGDEEAVEESVLEEQQLRAVHELTARAKEEMVALQSQFEF